MLNLALTTDKISLITSGTPNIAVTASWVDDLSNAFTPGKTNTAISSATTTDIVPVPGASTIRNVKNIVIRNTHATTANTCTAQYNANGTLYELFKATLAAGEVMMMNDAGVWFVYDTNGGVKMGASAASDTLAGLVAYAIQSDMETATSNILAVTPGRLKFHPGVAKATMHTTGTATPVADAGCTYNCTLTDTGVGQLTVNFTTAFSGAQAYCVQVNVEIISTTLTQAANVMGGYMRFGGQAAGSSCQVNCCDGTATTAVIRDPIAWHVVCFGDQ